MARRAPLLGSWLVLSGLALGCASARPPLDPNHGPSTPESAPGDERASPSAKARPKPPTPSSITLKEPGGDAADVQEAALYRQIDEAWGQREDKDSQLLVPLPDSEHWKRVRYFGVEHFVGFRYGKNHHALAVGFVQEMPAGTPVNTDTCMRRFEAWGRPQTKPFDVKFGPFNVEHQRWRDQRLDIHTVDGSLPLGFSTTSFSAAWAAFPAYPDACLIFAIAVPWRDHPELAKEVRDRWVKEGFVQMAPQTTERPVRKEASGPSLFGRLAAAVSARPAGQASP